MFIELHMIQNFPPSNLNRDDLGQPKDCDFGGYRRARISSQCLKRAIRYAGQNEDTGVAPLFERYTKVPSGKRTKLLADQVRQRLVALGRPDQQALDVAGLFAQAYAGKMDEARKEKRETAVLLYLSESEFAWVTEQLNNAWPILIEHLATLAQSPQKQKTATQGEKKAEKPDCSTLTDIVKRLLEETKGRSSAPDIALFGRMLADKPETNVDAACQVAHAISTHSIAGKTPIDYYTAVDDLKPKEETGAGFLDVAYFNSACFYRYARLDYEQLKANLGAKDLQGNDLADLPLRTVEAFMRASEAAIPPGKKNAFAQECRPSFMMAVVRSKESAGWSLVNAFQKPVDVRNKNEEDLVRASVQKLEKHFLHLMDFYGKDTVEAVAIALPDGTVWPDDLDERLRGHIKPNLDAWVDAVCDAVSEGE